MMFLKDLFQGLGINAEPAALNKRVNGVFTDSRSVIPGSVFIALKGHADDGMRFIPQALDGGAIAIVSHQLIPSSERKAGIVYAHVPDTRAFLRDAVKMFYLPESSRVKTIGITGTNGKTTTAYLIAHILESSGHSSGIIGTIAYHIGQKIYPSPNTTPGFVETHQWLSLMAQEKVGHCVMEVSSHALDQGRVDLVDFSCAVFTNLTDEHLDYHKTKEDYFQAKARLFVDLSSKATAVINVDDEYGRRLMKMSQAKVISYGIYEAADLKAENIRLGIEKTLFDLRYQDQTYAFESMLVGKHNVENLLAGIGAALSQGISMEMIQKAVQTFSPVKGRLEKVETAKSFSVIIDYAHTPDALEKILQTVRGVTDKKVILVFGCGGDRDRTKRPKMGKIAGQLADFTIVTSDNPRSEDPQAILNEIVQGFESNNFEVVIDRKEAIAKALKRAKSGEVILIAGKGHEDYQILKTGKIPFDERVIVKECLKEMSSPNVSIGDPS